MGIAVEEMCRKLIIYSDLEIVLPRNVLGRNERSVLIVTRFPHISRGTPKLGSNEDAAGPLTRDTIVDEGSGSGPPELNNVSDE